ncbi:amidohydrolase [Flaviaesturariibacter flavus]|uniref:Amidohydrolase n=1 Tax=Flaviaesturariibacter flavus TaxID=2502780 RepID=A0A4R1BMF0_9BACT|nr:amidohydrolase family protein [Flaviaesturariibacter flavus]TCJ18623.1 amidohydrolase [Flaviaesturariibacter flavus]
MRKLNLLAALLLAAGATLHAQETFPVNGVADPRNESYAFTHATIVKDGGAPLTDAMLVVRNGRIVSVGPTGTPPAGATVIDCKGKYLYPSFIDAYSDYGMPQAAPRAGGFNPAERAQLNTNTKGAYGWNQAVHPEQEAYRSFAGNDAAAKGLRDLGFGTVLTHIKDGIARGTGALVALRGEKDQMALLRERASAHYSFSKGTSGQAYPSSMMGSIALLRQTYLDAQWYKNKPANEGLNLSLQAWNDQQALPQVFEANDKWNDIRADRIGDEFGVQYIIKAGGNEYQRIRDIAGTKATYILSLNFPQTQDVEDPNDARFVSLNDLKHWELAPTNPAAFEKAGILFAITTADLRDPKTFWANLRTAINYGLSEKTAFDALTRVPAQMLGVWDQVGSLEPGKWANMLITSGPIFNEKTIIYQNWVQGQKYSVRDDSWRDMRGLYKITLNTSSGPVDYMLNFRENNAASLIGRDTVTSRFYYDGRQVRINVAPERQAGRNLALSGIVNEDQWSGTGIDTAGNRLTWTAVYQGPGAARSDSGRKRPVGPLGKVTYPFMPFGWDSTSMPKQETILIRNATVWTNEAEGIRNNTDVLVRDGKIAAIGQNLNAGNARVIDGTGKHLTPGVIDEHSHIATSSINEGGQSVTSEVRIADNLNPDDINIYRQLSGGVTTSHILHGSANTIGGQTQLIKLRWGANDEGLKFQGADGFIKFALGENVKRSFYQLNNNTNNNRFPDTRMGVEQVLVDAFTRAHAYENAWKAYNSAKNKKGLTAPRRDLELDALVEILNNKRFITCHSYVQSEINAAMKVAEQLGYKYNTFTHILEGYKVADKMKAHGANASTFSDWWNYKMEVVDAIPYNARLMQQAGLNVAINSDDAEMARRLNQEAAKSVKYGGMSEEDALKMVTLNPAKMLHIDKRVGSIRPGKDADLVLWSDNPLSIYARSLYTIVDGTVYFDREKDLQLRQAVAAERGRLIRKMNSEKRSGVAVTPAQPSYQTVLTCGEHHHSHGILTMDDQVGQDGSGN